LRSGLTIFAVAIAGGAVVSLVGISAGFERSFLSLYEGVGIDLVVVRAGLRQRLTSSLDEKVGDQIERVAGVKRVFPGLVDVIAFEDVGLYGVLVQGWTTPLFNDVPIKSGRHINPEDGKAVMLGCILAANLGKNIHDTVEFYEGEKFEVVGVFESRNVLENGCMLVSLEQLQRLMDRPGKVSGFSVVLEPGRGGRSIADIRQEIEALAKGLNAMPVREHVETLAEIRAARAMAWLTSAVALLVGTAGMLNTMIMSVHERTKEIGILRAIGWRKIRIVRMVLSESLTLSLIGATIGAVGAIILVRLLTRLPAASGFIDGHIPAYVVAEGFVIATLVGLCGGMTAAYSTARVLPTTALRHM